MVGQAGGQPARRLAAIMFTDLVGYSALAHRDEKLAIELLEVHRAWIREILPMHGGIEIETVGDAFLIEFAGALAAVECAIAIQQRFAEHNSSAPGDRRMQLRIGVHLGDIEHKDGKVMGDGVNIASRIHGIADPGGICVSEAVQQAVSSRGFAFAPLGAPSLKNIDTRLQLYGLHAAPVRGLARVWAPLRQARRAAVVAAAVAALGAAAVGVWRSDVPADKSVAVLPFANLSADKSSDYFVDGVHDAIISHLASVRELKVISRTSVMEYRDAARNLREIGKALGVAHVVEGSVQKAGDRIRVTAQLIRVADDEHVWAETYDRPDADVLAIQSDIAEKVATGTRAALAVDERDRIHDRPTANAEAYDHYLQGIAYERHARFNRDELYPSHALLTRAVALDPDFALAHAALARLYMYAHWDGLQDLFPSAKLREKSRAAAAEALRLGPDLAEAHEAMAQYHYQGHRDYAAALGELEIALRLQPGSPTAHAWLANIRRRQGRWQEALESHLKVCELDPRNAWEHWNTGRTYELLRRFEEAADYYSRAVTLSPQTFRFRIAKAWLEVSRTGDMGAMRRTLSEIPESVDQGGAVAFARFELAMYEKRYADAGRMSVEDESDSGLGAVRRGHALALAGLAGEARGSLERGLELAEKAIEEEPDEAIAHAVRGIALAMLDRAEEAAGAAQRAMEILPISRDAVEGQQVAQGAAIVYAQAGEHARAIRLLEELLRLPGDLTAHELRLDPWWKPLWSDPRFQKLVDEHLPKPA